MTDRYPIPEFLRRPVEAPRERPIIFSASMIRALLAGTKTQTRRPLYTMRKFSTASCVHRNYPPPHELTPVEKCWALTDWRKAKTGDVLWVREAWAACDYFATTSPRDLPRFAAIKYIADGQIVGAEVEG